MQEIKVGAATVHLLSPDGLSVIELMHFGLLLHKMSDRFGLGVQVLKISATIWKELYLLFQILPGISTRTNQLPERCTSTRT